MDVSEDEMEGARRQAREHEAAGREGALILDGRGVAVACDSPIYAEYVRERYSRV